MEKNTFSRRDFLKVTGSSAVIALWLASGLPVDAFASSNIPTPIYYHARTRCYSVTEANRYLDAGDDVTILSTDGTNVAVHYPTSSGSRTSKFALSDLLPLDWATRCSIPYEAVGQFATYKSATSNDAWGYVAVGDTFYWMAARESGRYWLIYPVSGGAWKLAAANISEVEANAHKKSSSSSSSSAAISLSVVDYKQTNGNWMNEPINPSYDDSKTIGQVGCLTCAIAELLTYHSGTTVTPINARNMLSYNGNNLVWESVTNVGLSFTGDYGCSISQTIMQEAYRQLAANNPVIIGGKNNYGGQHWVVITGYTSSDTSSFDANNFQINDPNSDTRKTLKAFLNKYPTVRRLIY